MTARPPYPAPQTAHNARKAEALTSPSYDAEPRKPLLSRLYGHAYRAWLNGNRDTFDRLRPLLADLISRKEELTPEQDAALRRTYKLEEKA